MLILRKEENTVKVRAEIPEDLWHLEKIIKPGDLVSGASSRKYVSESGQERKPVFVTLEVEKVEYHKGFEKLRILGVIKAGKPEEYVQLREHHSLDIGPGNVISIQKVKWMKYELDRLKEAQKAARRPKISILTMDEEQAELFLIREYGMEEKGKILSHMSGKYSEEKKEKIRNKYYEEIHDLLSKVETEKLILAGPGFEPENFLEFLKKEDSDLSKKIILKKTGWIGKSSVIELVNTGAIDDIIKESRFAEETKVIESIITELPIPGSKVVYGFDNVKKNLEMGALSSLIVLDSSLFSEREKYDALLNTAEKMGTKVMIISHENESSKKLEALGGIAAFLRFRVN